MNIWEDLWLPDRSVLVPIDDNNSQVCGVKTVADLLLYEPREWDIARLMEVFPPLLIQAIIKIPLLLKAQSNSLI